MQLPLLLYNYYYSGRVLAASARVSRKREEGMIHPVVYPSGGRGGRVYATKSAAKTFTHTTGRRLLLPFRQSNIG